MVLMQNELVGRVSYSYVPKKLDLDLKNRATHPSKPSIMELPFLELMTLPSYLYYVLLVAKNTLPIIIVADLLEW